MVDFIEIVESDETFDKPFGSSVIVLRRFDSKTLKDFEKKNSRRQKNFRTGGWAVDVDTYGLTDDLVDHVITDWRGVKNPITKADVPCTRENKLKLPTVIKIEIMEACDAEAIDGPTEEDETKNS